MTRTLAIDCSTEAFSVAIFDGDALLANEHTVLGRGHAERLVPMIAALPERGRAERILVALGPGSFTGIRIGIATARALGVAWQATVLGYPTLALVAAMARDGRDGPVTVCMTGGHGEWFVQDFGRDGMPETQLVSLTPEEAIDRGTHAFVAGSKARELAERLDPPAEALDLLPDASRVMLLPEATLTDRLSALYGRAPDAKPLAQQLKQRERAR